MIFDILYYVFLLLVVSIDVWLAIRVKRHPERDFFMRGVMKEQKGTEYEKRMQKYFIFCYLYGCVLWLWFYGFYWFDSLFEIVSELTLAMAYGLVWYIVRWRCTGKFNKWGFIVLATLVSLGIGYNIWAYQSSKVEVLPDKLSIEGNYGIAIPYQSIDSVFILNELPETGHCIDGHNLLSGKRGKYRLENGPVAMFYVLRKKGPYLMMYTYPGLIIVNRKTAAETEQLIEELREKIGDKMKG